MDKKICLICKEEITDDETIETPNLILPLCLGCCIYIEDDISKLIHKKAERKKK